MQLPEIPDKIPIKKRKILGPIARFLLSKYNCSIVGKFPNRKKMILIGAPHTAHRDAWFGLLVVLSLDLRVNFFGAKWVFSRLPSPITFSKDLDRLGIPWPLGWLQKYMLVRLGGIPVHLVSQPDGVHQLFRVEQTIPIGVVSFEHLGGRGIGIDLGHGNFRGRMTATDRREPRHEDHGNP